MLSALDGLTGLVNRRKFDEIFSDEWQRAFRSATAMTVIMMDIDCFKMFNDTFGHQQGDNCLLSVASTLKGMDLRHLDKIARIGGEEFAVILPETDSNSAMIVAERIRKTIEALKSPHSKASGNP